MSCIFRPARTAAPPVPRTMLRAHPLRARSLRTLCLLLAGFFPAVSPERSSSETSPPSPPSPSSPPDDAELFRDAPLYPPLRDSEPYRYNDLAQTNNHDSYTSQNKYFYKTLDNDQSEVEIRDKETTDFNYDEPETSIEDSSILVTPDDPNVPDDSGTETKPAQKIFELYSDETNFFTPENEYQSQNPFSNKPNDYMESDIYTNEPKARYIIAPGSNSNEINSLLDDEASVENEENVQNIDVTSNDEVGDDDGGRLKRSSGQSWDKPNKSRRVKTGDTILNIRGAVRDAIGDAGAAPGPRASSRIDAFVIRPSPVMRDEPRDQVREAEARRERTPTTPQPPKLENEMVVGAHTHARIGCDLHNVTSVRWHKENELISLPPLPDGGDSPYMSGSSVVIPRASRDHAARWRCSGRDKAGRSVAGQPTRLLIYEAVRSVYLAVDGRRLDAGNTWVPVRDKTVLEVRCVAEGGVPSPELSWRLLALEPALDHRPYLRIHRTNYSVEGVSWSRVVVTAARELHNATLLCEAKQRGELHEANYTRPHMSAKLEIHVTYPPSFVISRWPGFGVSLWAGGGAALRCDVDSNPPARAVWTRDSPADMRYPHSSPAPMESSDGSATLRWSRLQVSHAGWYQCRANWLDTQYSSIGYYLNVMSPDESAQTSVEPEAEETVHQKVEVPLGGNVQLHCPKGSVGCWWRRVVGNASDSWAPAGSHHAHGVLGISEAMWEEGGEYRCVGTRASERARLRELKRVTLSVTGGATAKLLSVEPVHTGWRLTCGVCGRNLRVVWLTNGNSQPASLTPDLNQHCWRTTFLTPDVDEAWCVSVSSNGGAVAVFPKRVPPSLSPARHAVRALQSRAPSIKPIIFLLVFTFVNLFIYNMLYYHVLVTDEALSSLLPYIF